ncbi:MAG: hypothetical protein RR998_04205 [Oscillospiraceae bacterium]
MCATEQLLICIHQTAEMGAASIEKLIESSKDETFRKKLADSREQYKRIWLSADTLLKSREGDDRGISGAAKMMSNLNIELATLRDGSTARLMEMLRQGNERGLETLEKAFAEYGADADEEIVNLADVLRKKLLSERREIDNSLSGR